MKSQLRESTVDPEFLSPLEARQKSDERAIALARGSARLYDTVMNLAEDALRLGRFRLKIGTMLSLQKEAYLDVDAEAGCLRRSPVRIGNSPHTPPPASDVPRLLEEMCDYVNDNWDIRSSLHLSAYVLWRLLWIHPFVEGNGTVARALSYVVLMVREGHVLPGKKTIPEQIASNRTEYYAALEAADSAWSMGRLDVSILEKLIETMLAAQLAS